MPLPAPRTARFTLTLRIIGPDCATVLASFNKPQLVASIVAKALALDIDVSSDQVTTTVSCSVATTAAPQSQEPFAFAGTSDASSDGSKGQPLPVAATDRDLEVILIVIIDSVTVDITDTVRSLFRIGPFILARAAITITTNRCRPH